MHERGVSTELDMEHDSVLAHHLRAALKASVAEQCMLNRVL
jgi:hypothetical protein